MPSSLRNLLALALTGAFFLPASSVPAKASQNPLSFIHADSASPEKIPAYQKRFGRSRPVIVVLAENGGTELTDFAIPYTVLSQSGVAEVFAVATQSGPITMRPALRIQPQLTVDQFDQRFPEGADYLIVPAMVKQDDPKVLAWITQQADKGVTVASICDGALVVANAGLLRDHRATAHWATQSLRAKKYPDTHWLKNIRYVSDGRMVSSAGISASMPISIALVEAIAGRDKADALANKLGVSDWSSKHDSDRFQPRFGKNITAFARTLYLNRWFHSVHRVGVPLSTGVDEIALAFAADAYSRTGRSQAFSVSASDAPVLTQYGLLVLPDSVAGTKNQLPLDRVLPAFDNRPSAQFLDQALSDIAKNFGRMTAYGVALDFEYPGFQP
ncbi:MAG TPA: DJ-1/PfpI family protein [Arenimonas sp.]|nr:DJ-1/PfpI family protein [Arenimonas sp.]